MTRVAELQIEMSANVARLTRDMESARNEVQRSTRGIQGHVAEMQKNIREHMEGVKKSQGVFKVMGELAGITELGAKLLELGKSAAEYGDEIEHARDNYPEIRRLPAECTHPTSDPKADCRYSPDWQVRNEVALI